MKIGNEFLPVSADEVAGRGWSNVDFVYVCGDAYVDHPSFGAAIITRVLEAHGFRVAMLCQPDWRNTADFKRFGKPRLGFLVSSGNIDSMVAHYTAAKKRRSEDFYSPGCKAGLRPDRAVIVYCNRIREAYGDVPILIGGLEASLRRFAHYDYWSDKVRRSIIVDSRADILMYGMGERTIVRLAELLERGIPVRKIRDVRGTAYLCERADKINYEPAEGYSSDGQPKGYDYDTLKTDKAAYAKAFFVQYRNNDAINGKAIVEYYDDKMLVVNPPQMPLTQAELDETYALPYMRTYHPMYEPMGGVPAISEVKFSITHNRGCFGGCNFCALAFHQGRAVTSRSIESCVEEAELIASMTDFKGYIHDVGGPTANFRRAACDKQLEHGVCQNKRCLVPHPCKNLIADHTEYIKLLSAVEAVKGVKKVFIRSGVRFDYLLADPDDSFFRKLVKDHVSGQLKVAPEHCSSNVLSHMGKPDIAVYDKFREKYAALNEELGRNQYLVPYLMSSHPGSTMDDAAELALYTKRIGLAPEQVQDFYPTPGTASTVMFYTGIDPFTGKQIYTATDYREKQLQRALLQWRKPENRRMIYEAMNYCSDKGKEMLKELLGGSSENSKSRSKAGSNTSGNRQAGKNGKKENNGKSAGSSNKNPKNAAGNHAGKPTASKKPQKSQHSAQSAQAQQSTKKYSDSYNNGYKGKSENGGKSSRGIAQEQKQKSNRANKKTR